MSSLIIRYLNLSYPGNLTFSQSNYHNNSVVFSHDGTEIGITRLDRDLTRINNQTHTHIFKLFGDDLDSKFISECVIEWLLIKYNSNNIKEILVSEWFGFDSVN